MQLGTILDFLKKCYEINIDKLIQSESPSEIRLCKLLDSHQTFFLSHCLYLGFVTDLPNETALPKPIDGGDTLNLLLIQNRMLNSTLLQDNYYNIFFLPLKTNLDQIYTIILSALTDENRQIEVMNRILNDLYANKGLQTIISTAAEIFENSILLNDISYNILAKSYYSTTSKELFENIIGNGFIQEDTITEMRETGIFSTIRKSTSSLLAQQKSTKNRWLFQSVKINNTPVADIAVFEENRPFRYIDFILIDFLTKVVAIEMQKDEFFKNNKDKAYSHFIQELLDGTLNKENIISQRAKMLGLKLFGNYWIVVAKLHNQTAKHDNIDYITAQLLQIIPDGKWITYQQMSIALFSRKTNHVFSDSEYTKLQNFACDNQLSIGLSDLFYSPVQIPIYYKQAQHACTTLVPGKSAYGIKVFSEVLIYHIIQVMKNQLNYKELLHPALLKLEQYDHLYNTELMLTLEQYLICACNAAKTASNLNIHRNTLLYRINRIREITDINFESGDELFKMMLHIKIRNTSFPDI